MSKMVVVMGASPFEQRSIGLVCGRWAARIANLIHVPAWLLYRVKHLHDVSSGLEQLGSHQVEQALAAKEESIRTILRSCPRSSFLEIGIGSNANIERLRLMEQMGISYTGCDFDFVCNVHRRQIEREIKPPPAIRFLTNRVGTYSWQLFECLTRGEAYDIIYLDGHHTFYADLPALIIADQLLKPNGYLLIDDVKWTLSFLRSNMVKRFSDWSFYHKMYDFELYDASQQRIEHIKWMAEELLLKRRGYRVDSRYSTPLWWTLGKPDRS
jgi:hypothetical protein